MPIGLDLRGIDHLWYTTASTIHVVIIIVNVRDKIAKRIVHDAMQFNRQSM